MSRSGVRRHFLFSFSLISLFAQRENSRADCGRSMPGMFLLRRINTKWRCPVFCVVWWLRSIVRRTLAPSQFPSTIQTCSRNHQFFSFKVQLLRILRHLTARKEKSAKHAQLMLEIIGQMIKRVVLWKHESKACFAPNRPDKKGNEMVSFPS